MENRYFVYSDYLKQKYGEKVYKLPLNLPLTCPNRDGSAGYGGCSFCSDLGAGFESHENTMSIEEQLKKNKDYIGKRYKAKKFIAYFQNYTNTYMDFEMFKRSILEAIIEDVVEISISTRPDCVNDKHLEFLCGVRDEHKIEISFELGLQTVNYHTLKRVNRGHGLAEFIDSVIRIKKYGFEVCAHIILNLPGDNMDDAVENAKIASALSLDGVKLHSLYIARNTKMAEEYEAGEFDIISMEEYVNRVVEFIRHLKPQIPVHRIAGRAPKEETLFCNWDTSWWKIKDMIEEALEELDAHQGDKCDYLNGGAARRYV